MVAKSHFFFKELINDWFKLTDNNLPKPENINDIYNEPLFFNQSTKYHNNPTKYLLKAPPVWAKDTIKIIGDLCKIFTPGFLSFEMFKLLTERQGTEAEFTHFKNLIPRDWQAKISRENGTVTETNFNLRTYTNKWVVKNIKKLSCKDFYRTLNRLIEPPELEEEKLRTWTNTMLTVRQWETIFQNLYNKTKQKEAFDIQYRFLQLAHPTAVKLKEMRITQSICPRCGEGEETHQHWLYWCSSSQRLFKFILKLIKKVQPEKPQIQNTLENVLVAPLLGQMDDIACAKDLYEIYYITISDLRKKAAYRIFFNEIEEIGILKTNIKHRLGYLQSFAKIKNELDPFMRKWTNIYDRQGEIHL